MRPYLKKSETKYRRSSCWKGLGREDESNWGRDVTWQSFMILYVDSK